MKKLAGAVILTACSVAMVAGQPGAPQRNTPKLSTMIDRVRPSVVRISSFWGGAVPERGTGFFVSPDGIVVTAKHVISHGPNVPCDTSPLKPRQPIQPPPNGVPEQKPAQAIEIKIEFPQVSQHTATITMMSSFINTRARVLACDDRHDIALLEPEHNPLAMTDKTMHPIGMVGGKPFFAQTEKREPAVLSLRAFRDGDPVFTSGYPLENATLITTSGYIASSEPVGVDEVTGKFEDVYWADIHVNPGNSGGPAFSLEAGTVVGMVRAYQNAPVVFDDDHSRAFLPVQAPDKQVFPKYLDSNSGIAEIIPVEFIERLLRDKKVKFSAR